MKNEDKVLPVIFIIAAVLVGLSYTGLLGSIIPLEKLGNYNYLGDVNYQGHNFSIYTSYSGEECKSSSSGSCDQYGQVQGKGIAYVDSATGYFMLSTAASQNNKDNGNEVQRIYAFDNSELIQELIIPVDGVLSFTQGRDASGQPYSSFGFGLTDGSQLFDIYSTSLASTYSGPGRSVSDSVTYEPVYYRIKNNYDGTYSISKGIGYDTFQTLQTLTIKNPVFYLYSSAAANGPGGGDGSVSAISNMRVLSLITITNEVADCKIDEIKNGTTCVKSPSLDLNYQPSLHESTEDIEARIQQRLADYQTYADAQIAELRAQLANSSLTQAQSTQIITKIQTIEASKPDVDKQTQLALSKVSENIDMKQNPNLFYYIAAGVIGFLVIVFIILKMRK